MSAIFASHHVLTSSVLLALCMFNPMTVCIVQVALPGRLFVYELVTDANQNAVTNTTTTTTSPVSFSSTAPTSPHSQTGGGGGRGGGGGQYRTIHKLTSNVECSLLVLCDHHIILCQERKLICLSLQGDRERYIQTVQYVQTYVSSQ